MIPLNNSNTACISKGSSTFGSEDVVGSFQDTLYLCNFRVSVDGEWLCLKELQKCILKDGVASITPFGESNDRDPASIERSNLVNICKLIVKELLKQSLRFGRMLDSDYLPLQHFFIVLEHILRHGLRSKKGLLGPKKELWDILQNVEKYCVEAHDITVSVRDLPTVKTHMGRARAWLRIALMQKKLADYIQALVENKNESYAEFYEPHALMMSEEVIIILGILVGLNVIDCNLCVKEEDLDSQQGVIDFSLYLRSSLKATSLDEGNEVEDNMTAVLDQKNYIEELNRHLNATITNLQSKVESLTTTNALMKEDLAIARNSLLALQADLGIHKPVRSSTTACNQLQHKGPETTNNVELTQVLNSERRKNQELQKELKLQISIKAEKDMAMKLLEKEFREKEDTIVSLRRQLDEIKIINLDMYKKLQECEDELTQKGEVISRLQFRASQIGQILQTLEKNYESKVGDPGLEIKKLSADRSDNRSSTADRTPKIHTDVEPQTNRSGKSKTPSMAASNSSSRVKFQTSASVTAPIPNCDKEHESD